MSAVTEPCDRCGEPVTREVTGGFMAELAQKLKPICEACAATEEEEEREREAQEAEQARLSAVAERVKRSGLPEKYRSLVLSDLEQEPAVVAAALSWAVDGGGLLLTGDIGVGKTMTAGAAARTRMERWPMIWLTGPLLFARLGSGLDSPQREEMVSMLTSGCGLVLDDIDKTRPTDYGAEQTFLAVDQRIEHGGALLVTTNLSPSQLADRWPEPYGRAITSRLVGYCRTVRIGGSDRRLHQNRAADGAAKASTGTGQGERR